MCGAKYPAVAPSTAETIQGRNVASGPGRPEWNTGTYVTSIQVMTPVRMDVELLAATLASTLLMASTGGISTGRTAS